MLNRFFKKNRGVLPYCLFFQLIMAPSLVFANPFMDSPEPEVVNRSMPQFIYEVDGTLMAQTSEITIMLEKKVSPPAKTEIGQEIKAPENEKASTGNDDGGTSSGQQNGQAPSAIGQTASALETSPSVEFYEELEDPFGPAKDDQIPELKDPFEGYNRFMFNVNEGLYDYVMEPVAKGMEVCGSRGPQDSDSQCL